MSAYLLQAGVDHERLDAVEKKLRSSIPDLVRVASVEEAQRRSAGAGDARAYILLVAPSTETEYFNKLISTIHRYRGNVFFILISGEISASHYKQLIQGGNADWASENGLPTEVLDIIARADATLAPGLVAAKRPVVTSFVPSAGGVGNSTLAIETAVQLAGSKTTKGGKVCLIDLDFQGSHVCDYLDIEPRLRIDEIINAPQRLDDQLFNGFVSRHSDSLDVLAAPRNKLRDRSPSVEVVSALFDLIARRYVQVLVDLPLEREPWTGPVLAASQGILVVGGNTIPGLRQIAETLVAIHSEAVTAASIRVVINDCEFNMFGRAKRHDHVKRVLPNETPFFVRHSPAAIECVNTGKPMSLARPSDKAVKDVGAIVRFCAGLKPAVAPATV